MNNLYFFVLLLLCSYAFAQCASDTCDDGDYCTGTINYPDYCEDDTCTPGDAVCPTYIKQATTTTMEEIGSFSVINDEKWLYILWEAETSFTTQAVALYASIYPPQSDNAETFPYRQELAKSKNIQLRVSLDLIENPTELDSIYISVQLTNEEGEISWMSGSHTPKQQTNGGSFSYVSVCHCLGYSLVKNMLILRTILFLSQN